MTRTSRVSDTPMKENLQTDNDCEKELEHLALQSGLAIVVVKDDSAPVFQANNNSICEKLYSSEEFAPRCAEFCGRAFEDAVTAGEKIAVRCHAGLHYLAQPFSNSENHPMVAIIGRAFLKSDEYRAATTRAMKGDWKDFSPEDLFKNVLLKSGEDDFEKTDRRFTKILKKQSCFENLKEISAGTSTTETSLPSSESQEISRLIEEFHKTQAQPEAEIFVKKTSKEDEKRIEESAAWRAFFGSLLELEYKNAYSAILNFLAERHSFSNLAWLENSCGRLKVVLGYGDFSEYSAIEIGISPDDERLIEVFEQETSLELKERGNDEHATLINLFPLVVGGQVGGGLLIGDRNLDDAVKPQISHLVREISAELEVLRLREKIKRQQRTAKAVSKLNATLKEIDEDDFWSLAAQIAAELMHAERGSLLLVNEENQDLIVKAAVGSRADIIKREDPHNIGRRVASQVLESGKPLIVKNVDKSDISSAPADWKYKTKSFISYPIMIGGRKIGVLNVTDSIDGENYDESDLELLDTLSPQLAVAIDRTSLRKKARELRRLSITDALTGLLNRRYLEERLAEEVSRSQRHGYQMAFMMIDVDDFKSYNDKFTHPEGDKALQIVGQCLKATLRGADVAARYGGEEFSILLPQTNINEAYVIAERLREKVMLTAFPNRPVTISIGIASCTAETCNAKEIVSAADKALYLAKSKGRNNVQIYKGAVDLY